MNHIIMQSFTICNLCFPVGQVLTATASFEIRNCIHQLALSFAAALAHEERRCGFLTQQAKMMIAVYDEVTTANSNASSSVAANSATGATRSGGGGCGGGLVTGSGAVAEEEAGSAALNVTPYAVMLSRCLLARNLASALESLKKTGLVQLYVNNWIPISFCLPHKVHSRRTLESHGPLPSHHHHHHPHHKHQKPFKLSSVLKALSSLQPYHALLPLEESRRILEQLPVDCSPALVRVIRALSPLKTLETIATESDLALSQGLLHFRADTKLE